MSGKQIISIEQYLRMAGKFEQVTFTVAELEEIAAATGMILFDVMFYLRYGR